MPLPEKIIVGVTQRVDMIPSRDESRDALDQRLINWLVSMGCIPIPIPNTLVNLQNNQDITSQLDFYNWLKTVRINAVMLSGGNDIGDSKHRDLTENVILSWAQEHKIPVLGICRGMQMMAVRAGGGLIPIKSHVRVRHKLTVMSKDESFPNSVNSYHGNALKQCPEQFEILAISEDGCIEAIAHRSLPWEAWMWHPERETSSSTIDQIRFMRLINNA